MLDWPITGPGRLAAWPAGPIGQSYVRADWRITDILRSLPIANTARLADYPWPIGSDRVQGDQYIEFVVVP